VASAAPLRKKDLMVCAVAARDQCAASAGFGLFLPFFSPARNRFGLLHNPGCFLLALRLLLVRKRGELPRWPGALSANRIYVFLATRAL